MLELAKPYEIAQDAARAQYLADIFAALDEHMEVYERGPEWFTVEQYTQHVNTKSGSDLTTNTIYKRMLQLIENGILEKRRFGNVTYYRITKSDKPNTDSDSDSNSVNTVTELV